jgi:hypothetical protein
LYVRNSSYPNGDGEITQQLEDCKAYDRLFDLQRWQREERQPEPTYFTPDEASVEAKQRFNELVLGYCQYRYMGSYQKDLPEILNLPEILDKNRTIYVVGGVEVMRDQIQYLIFEHPQNPEEIIKVQYITREGRYFTFDGKGDLHCARTQAQTQYGWEESVLFTPEAVKEYLAARLDKVKPGCRQTDEHILELLRWIDAKDENAESGETRQFWKKVSHLPSLEW